MNKILVTLGCAVLLSALAGCQSPAANKSDVEVIIEGGGEFPLFLAGTWKADKNNWQLVFEPNGVISSAIVPITGVEI